MSNGDVTARVEAFIADFHAAWQRSGSVPLPTFNPFTAEPGTTFDPTAWLESGMPDFEAWERELGALVDLHFTAGARTGAEGGLSGKPAHDPAGERIVSAETRRSTATVQTVFPDGSTGDHYTYCLVLDQGVWRIRRIVHTFVVADQPLVPASEAERLVAAVDGGPAADPIPPELVARVARLFSDRYERVDLGDITTQGVLTVHDFGWVRHDLAPLARRVPAGTHSVDVARKADGTHVALRLRLSDQGTVTRLPASRIGFDHVIGVDAGNVALVDYPALAGCTEGRVEELYQDHALTREASVFSLQGDSEPAAVVVTSGYGDGAYPAYWGLDAEGNLTDLVVDFLVDVEGHG